MAAKYRRYLVERELAAAQFLDRTDRTTGERINWPMRRFLQELRRGVPSA